MKASSVSGMSCSRPPSPAASCSSSSEARVGLGEERAPALRLVVGQSDLGGLDAALDAVERLARQRGLRGDGHGGRRADQGGASEQRAEAAVAATGGGGHREALRGGRLAHERGVGLRHQALAQRPDELGARGDLGQGPQVGDDLEEVGVLLRVALGEGGVRPPGEECLELVGTSSCRECGCHCSRPVWLLVGPPTRTNEREEVRVTGRVTTPSTPPASAWPGCVRRAAGAA